ncbi:MAG: DUF1801 domain-containing protein [Gemmatimonadaceae bacterium]|nr:DUF1801 domain-containing protein [Gemmatimonadaceae bacterium]
MVISKATSPDAYLAELPADRRREIRAVRDALKSKLAKHFVEQMGYGMITYGIPLSRYPQTYNKQPLMFVALAAQKNFNALYLTTYGDEGTKAKVHAAFQAAGKTLDMDKSCIRFTAANDLPLEALGNIVGGVTSDQLIAMYEASRSATTTKPAKAPAKAAAKKGGTAAPKKK